jgi:hypothetical protein
MWGGARRCFAPFHFLRRGAEAFAWLERISKKWQQRQKESIPQRPKPREFRVTGGTAKQAAEKLVRAIRAIKMGSGLKPKSFVYVVCGTTSQLAEKVSRESLFLHRDLV